MTITTRSTDRALLVLRLAVAAVFFSHGYMKLVVMGHSGVEGFFSSLGVPLPGIVAWCVTLLETVGALAVAAGLFTRMLSLLFVADMLGAIGLALLPKGFRGFELEFLLMASSICLALAGGGAYSADAWLVARKSSSN